MGAVTVVSVTCALTAEMITALLVAIVILGLVGVVPEPEDVVGVASSGEDDWTPRKAMAVTAIESEVLAVPVQIACVSTAGSSLPNTPKCILLLSTLVLIRV